MDYFTKWSLLNQAHDAIVLSCAANIEEIARFNLKLSLSRSWYAISAPYHSSLFLIFTLFSLPSILPLCVTATLFIAHSFLSASLSLSLSLSFFMAPALEAQVPQGEETVAQNNFSSNVNDDAHRSKVTVIGSGNWGSVAAKLIASNTLRLSSFHGTFSRVYSSVFFEFW